MEFVSDQARLEKLNSYGFQMWHEFMSERNIASIRIASIVREPTPKQRSCTPSEI